jgi:hypothetical protein
VLSNSLSLTERLSLTHTLSTSAICSLSLPKLPMDKSLSYVFSSYVAPFANKCDQSRGWGTPFALNSGIKRSEV